MGIAGGDRLEGREIVNTNIFRRKIHLILDVAQPDDKLGRAVDIGLISLITLNVISVIIESLPGLDPTLRIWFDAFEYISVLVFTIEYVLRVWSSVEAREDGGKHPFFDRLRYMASPLALIDLVVIAPFYLTFIFSIDLRMLRVLRLLRIFKLTRYSSSMSMLLAVLKDEARAIGAAMFVLMLLVIITASLTYLLEHPAQPVAFSSIPAAMWWAVITMTTVGYGDMVPITVLGKIMGAVISIIGIGMVALPAGLLASGFSNELHRRKREYTDVVENALQDGVLTERERAALDKVQEDLGIRPEDAKEILETEIRISGDRIAACPHCGLPLRVHDRRDGDKDISLDDD